MSRKMFMIKILQKQKTKFFKVKEKVSNLINVLLSYKKIGLSKFISTYKGFHSKN